MMKDREGRILSVVCAVISLICFCIVTYVHYSNGNDSLGALSAVTAICQAAIIVVNVIRIGKDR